jgi:hypothetical protein
MNKLTDNLIQEIIEDSNYTNYADVRMDIENGDIEIYENKAEYEEEGYSLEYKDGYTLLSNGNIAHYIHG